MTTSSQAAIRESLQEEKQDRAERAGYRSGVTTERERCRKIVSRWLVTGHMKLHAGEMSAAETRSVKAVLSAIRREIVAP